MKDLVEQYLPLALIVFAAVILFAIIGSQTTGMGKTINDAINVKVQNLITGF